jgi:ribosomal-protein-alanine N-acetyltransferase
MVILNPVLTLPPFLEFPILTFGDFCLRQCQPNDLEQLLEISYFNGIQAVSIEEAADMLECIDFCYKNGESIHWVIERLSDACVVGTCGFYRGFEDGLGEVGCVLKENFRGQGIMTQISSLLFNFGFDYMNLNAIVAITNSTNQSAINLIERIGFQKTGVNNNNTIRFMLYR